VAKKQNMGKMSMMIAGRIMSGGQGMCAMSNVISRFGLLSLLILLPAFAAADSAQDVQWGNQLMRGKKYDDAMKYFSGAIKADPRNPLGYKGMGYAYVYKGDKAHALQYLKYASQLNPADTQLSQYIASIGGNAPFGSSPASDQAYQNGIKYMQARQFQYAAYYFDQATKIDPTNSKSWQGLGNAFFQQGRKDKAIEAWNKAIALDPSNTQLANYVASITPPAAPAPAPDASVANAPASASPSSEKQLGFNPWIMGGTIAALGAVMLFLF
jgi:tetratricopeptide (TPR) repeat protein